MSTAIIPFDFESHAVRSVIVDGKPWFVAADVCRVLEIRNHRDAVSGLDDDEKGVGKTDTLGGTQEMIIVSESGLIGLTSKSNKPVAKRFWKWVRSVLLPALIRDGYYAIPGVNVADRAELDAKRAYYAALPDVHKGRAAQRAEAVARIEGLIAEGMRVSHAIRLVAEETGISERSLYTHRGKVYMVPQGDWQAAMAPRWNGPRAMLAECHPEALMMMFRLVASGGRYSESHARVVEEAAVQGWAPVAHIRTMSRAVQRMMPRLPNSPKTKKEAA